MAAELEPIGVEGEDYNLVEKHGKTIVVPIRKEGDPYDANPQIRALQLVQEGRIGGAGRGQGRKRKPRAAEIVAEAVKQRSQKIIKAIDSGLDHDNPKLKMQAASMALEIEREEAKLTLKEDQADLENASKEELLATLIELVSDPATEAELDKIDFDLPASEIEEISDAEVVTLADREAEAPQAVGATRRAKKAGPDPSTARRNGRQGSSRDRSSRPNPWKTRT